MLFSKRDKDETAPKRRSILGTMLKPNFGASIRPIGESTRIFVNLIAMLFAMNGLFPKNHPAFANGGNNPHVRLTLRDVIATGWGNLSFTEKGAPQVLFFFATIASMALAVLALIIGLFSLFVGAAHAQGTTTPPSSAFFAPPAHDLAQNWIDFIFKGTALDTTYDISGSTVEGVTSIQNINLQCAMITALGFYSNALLMVAALILFYHLASMVVETAHHGQVMGKRANQVWAPIRLVVAVGLLVPVGNGPVACGNSSAGLNSAQYITIKIAELGSALASNTWSTFVKALVGNQFKFIEPQTPDVDKIVHDVFMMKACEAVWNYSNQTGNPAENVQEWPYTNTDTKGNVISKGFLYGPNPPIPDIDSICGQIKLPNQPLQSANYTPDTIGQAVPQKTQVQQAIWQAHQTAFNNMLTEVGNDVNASGNGDITYFVKNWNASRNNDGAEPNNQDFQTAVNDYITGLGTGLSTAVGTSNDILSQEVVTGIGWIGAGTWMNVIARDQGAMIDMIHDGLPSVVFTTPDPNQHPPLTTDVAAPLDSFDGWLKNGYNMAQMNQAPSPCDLEGLSGKAGRDPFKEKINFSKPIQSMLQYVDEQAQGAGIWEDVNYNCPANGNPNGIGFGQFQLGKQFLTSNPLGELTVFGYANMELALKFGDKMVENLAKSLGGAAVGGIASGIASILPSKGGYGVAKGVAGVLKAASGAEVAYYTVMSTILGALFVIFLTVGVTLGYVVPLIPFMHFFFSAVAWGLVLIEAVVAMPLVAIAHLNPEGDGLPSGMAKQAYFMLLGLFLRPVLLIFGFIIGLLIFMLSMFLLNKLYMATVVGTGGLATGFGTVSRIIFTVFYVFLAYSCAVNCFKIVDNFPESIFSWVNIRLGHQKIADGGSVLQNAAPLITGVAGQQLVGTAQQVAGQITNVVQK